MTHARRIVEQARQIIASCPSMLRALHDRYPNASIRTLSELVCALHDTGKLQIEWQAEAQVWQQHCDSMCGVSRDSGEPLADTTYDPERDKEGSTLPGFRLMLPVAHSPCCHISPCIFLKRLPVFLCTAIARHHGAHTSDLKQFELIATAAIVLEESLPEGAPRPLSVPIQGYRVDTARFSDDCLLHFSEDESCWPMYVGLVRILRLADQGSFQKQS